MEDTALWDTMNDYSSFLPDTYLDLFGDGAFDVDFTGLPCSDLNDPAGWGQTDANMEIFQSYDTTYPDLGNDCNGFPMLNSTIPLPISADTTPLVEHHTSHSNTNTSNCTSPGSPLHEETLSLKRKIEESMIVFAANADVKVSPKKRKAFSKIRKQEVAMNRLIGACIQCRLRKGRCDFGLPCAHCTKRAGTVELGQRICSRQSLVATRFNNIDLFRVSKHNMRGEQLRSWSGKGSGQRLYIGYRPVNYTTASTFISLPIFEFDDSKLPNKQLIVHLSYYGCSHAWEENSPHCISWDSLPTVDRLLQAFDSSIESTFGETGPFCGIQDALRRFCDAYCNSLVILPLQQLLKTVLRLQSLFGIYRYVPFTKSFLDDLHPKWASTAIRDQLRLLVSKEIAMIEAEILAEIDKRVYGSEGIGRQNPIALWVCLWTLILSYKDQRIFVNFEVPSASSIPSTDDEKANLYGLTQHIFNTLTSIYGALYKTTSPLLLDWRIEEVAEMLGKDEKLIKLFTNVKTEMYWFHSQKDHLFVEDALFKTLVVENENKLLVAHRKAAQKRGII